MRYHTMKDDPNKKMAENDMPHRDKRPDHEAPKDSEKKTDSM